MERVCAPAQKMGRKPDVSPFFLDGWVEERERNKRRPVKRFCRTLIAKKLTSSVLTAASSPLPVFPCFSLLVLTSQPIRKELFTPVSEAETFLRSCVNY